MQNQDYILFEDYLSGNLDPESVQAFQNRLETDLVFKEAFQIYKDASQFLENHLKNAEQTEAFKSQLEKVSSNYFKDSVQATSIKKRINPWFYSIAAAAVLVIGFFIGQQFSNPVYKDYANYGTISLTVRGNQDAILHKAETAFNNHNYKDAETYFSELLESDSTNIEFQLYKAVSLVELNHFNKAETLFNEIMETPSVYKNKAMWYLALSKLKQKNEAACISILKRIPEDAEDYQQAQKLLNKID
ncbi:hypothetical protein BZARG_1182 [Bizionia argentinensis JUB59]|uniref:Uncharacterized protein n=1 Tax=Bizionia argentinensis JUB59 TaxID=1046627 RepID=G2ECR3_9FLAO|nr:hypothetical protein [Bizionia argentinensis]EGV43742.1 hypothetical protein BZARG_1182 [Bizionia argentinensis JUB59]